MYEACISCPRLGNPCNGANFFALSTAAQLEWCKKRKNVLGWSNAKLAEEAKMPKGTVDSLLSGNRTGANTETLRPMFEALIGGYTDGKPCPNPPTEADISMEEKLVRQSELLLKHEKTIERLKKENSKLTDHITHTADIHHTEMAEARAEDKKEIEKQEKTIKFLRTVVSVLAVLLILSIGTICVALIMDRLNPNIGFFWLEETAATIFSGHTGGLFGDITGLKI